ncbi:uncharacterized protein LOC131856678 [Cryptomeria japonica]|uniref:uncharacterized protein LOC131856678 n=1 Tax=Cryptomeria japonica TaxID=3369 RepID=UPI0027DA1F28|nr:uncharacterized protein LOC131856678 [Cryptomeria japonica]
MEEIQRHGVMKFLVEKPLQGFDDNVLYICKKNIEWRNSVIKQGYEEFVKLGRELSELVQNMLNDLKCIGVKYMEDGQTIDTADAIRKSFEMQVDMVKSATVITKNDFSTIAKIESLLFLCKDHLNNHVDKVIQRKDAEFQFGILRDAIEEVGAANVVQVITDLARVCKSVGLMVEGAYKHIFWTPRCVHALNNALKDIGKIDWVKQVVAEARDIQMFICNHHTSLALFRSFSKKEFLKPVETRYATYFILLERMLEVHDPLQLMVVNPEWGRWRESNSTGGKSVKQKILDDNWWSTVRYADTDSPSLGEIYETFDSMLGKIKQTILAKDPTLGFYEQHIRPIVTRRWNIMNTPLHMAAYALNPKWYAPKDGRLPPCDDDEVLDGFTRTIDKIYTEEQASILRAQFLDFTNLRGPTLSKPQARLDIAILAQRDPIGWWTWHGRDTLQLKLLATRLLSQVASSSAAERNWSTYGFIHSIKRNRFTSRRAEKLVAVHSALRLQDRQTPALRWDVDPKDVAQVDEEETPQGLVGIPLDEVDVDQDSGIDSEDSDFDAMLGDVH